MFSHREAKETGGFRKKDKSMRTDVSVSFNMCLLQDHFKDIVVPCRQLNGTKKEGKGSSVASCIAQ